MMFVGFLGCYGAIQESQCLLGTVRSWAGYGVGSGAAGGRIRGSAPARPCEPPSSASPDLPGLFSDPTEADCRYI